MYKRKIKTNFIIVIEIFKVSEFFGERIFLKFLKKEEITVYFNSLMMLDYENVVEFHIAFEIKIFSNIIFFKHNIINVLLHSNL